MPSDQKHSEMIGRLREAQEAEYDNRQMVREADHFLNKRDGQWEPEIINRFGNKPRYTFDESNPIVDDIMGEMSAAEFNVRVSPSGSEASRDTAQIFEGIIRTIENISNARHIYDASARIMVGTGIDGWRVVQAYRDDNSFQQDLLIKKIPDFQNSVWFDPGSVDQTMEDSEETWVLTSLTKREYDSMFPEGSGNSVQSDMTSQVYSYKKPNEIVVGEYLYRVRKKRQLALMSDGSVFVIDDDFKKVIDEMAGKGVRVVRTREREYHEVYQKIFDGSDWLRESSKTVFSYIPIIPVYGNFRISESKVIYRGIVESIRDAQRVINYAESRKIEETALSPRGKIWMTKDQAQSPDVRQTLRTLNTNMDPVQFYDFADGQGVPQYMGSPTANPALSDTSISAQNHIQRTSGTFDEARGAAPAHRSGEAVNLLQKKSDNPKRKWFTSMEIAIQHTGKILVDAIPKVYDTQQQMILTGRDGTQDKITIRQRIRDSQSGQIVELNDLSKGTYDVVCSSGPAFQSRQQETVTAINEMAALDPSILQIGADILLNNITAPGIDKIAERKRLQMVMSGVIPQSQMTQEEKKIAAQAAQQNDMTPLDRANLQIAAAQEADVQGKNTERAAKLQLEQQKLMMQMRESDRKNELAQQKQLLEAILSVTEQVKAQAETLKLIKDAIGVDAILGRAPMRAFETQARELSDNIGKQEVPNILKVAQMGERNKINPIKVPPPFSLPSPEPVRPTEMNPAQGQPMPSPNRGKEMLHGGKRTVY